jgi:hypothetical protein
LKFETKKVFAAWLVLASMTWVLPSSAVVASWPGVVNATHQKKGKDMIWLVLTERAFLTHDAAPSQLQTTGLVGRRWVQAQSCHSTA